mgnify:FL=1
MCKTDTVEMLQLSTKGPIGMFSQFFPDFISDFQDRRSWWLLTICLLCMLSLLYINIHMFWFISSHRLLTGCKVSRCHLEVTFDTDPVDI